MRTKNVFARRSIEKKTNTKPPPKKKQRCSTYALPGVALQVHVLIEEELGRERRTSGARCKCRNSLQTLAPLGTESKISGEKTVRTNDSLTSASSYVRNVKLEKIHVKLKRESCL